MEGAPEAHPNEALIERLYDALGRRDGDTMAACYAPDAVFSDPAFGELHGGEIGRMWRMLTSRASSLDVDLVERQADDSSGTAHWIARYPFARTGRQVVNDVRARFGFRDGLIVEHRDHFDLRRWAAQALGVQGRVLGFTPFLSSTVQRQARGQLAAFEGQ
jgi:ketosteroid isomerase-like protein